MAMNMNNQITQLSYNLSNQKRLLNELTNELKSLDIETYQKQFHDLSTIAGTFELLKEKVIHQNKLLIENSINSALHSIFQSETSIEIVIDNKPKQSKPKYDILYSINGETIGNNSTILKSDGGSLIGVVSLLFKVTINKLIGNSIIFVDEDLSQLSQNYAKNASKVLSKLSKTFGMTIVMITHIKDLSEFADKVYITSKTKDTTNGKFYIKETKHRTTPNPTDPKFTLSIKNFQSIEDVSFDYEENSFIVILGNGRIGKSSSFRAFRSLVYGDYHQSFRRKSATGKTVVKLEYKNNVALMEVSDENKIFYTLNDKRFYGIRKAKERLRDFFKEKFGFNYIDTSKLSANETKKALDSIMCGTQFDKAMLVNASSNQLDTTLEILFNTSLILSALSKAREDLDKLETKLNRMKQKHEAISSKLELIQSQISSDTKDLLETGIKFVSQILSINQSQPIDELQSQLDEVNQSIKTYQLTLQVDKLSKDLNDLGQRRNEKQGLEQKESTLSKIDKIYSVMNILDECENLTNDEEDRINKEIEVIDDSLRRVKKAIKLHKVDVHLQNVNQFFTQQKLYQSKKNELTQLEQNHKCPKCQGVGMI
jgi:energy-coupling factor transporter ATP-binding protein EcfA2